MPPARTNVPTVSVWPPRSKVPPATVSEPVSTRRSDAPRRRVPAETVVPPVCAVVRARVRMPAPALLREPVPLSTPPSV